MSVGAFAPAQEILYTGTWRQSNCACFLAGHTSFTTMSGARATFTRTYEAGDQVALVMAEGPGRGKAGIRVDGKCAMKGMTAGVHAIAIVNQGTSARSRIDLDAILLGTGIAP